MRAVCLTLRDPFRPLARQVREVRRPARIRSLAPKTRQPFVALLDGRPILRAGWRRRLRDGETLVFAVLPAGGGNGGSNPLRTLLSLALFAFAPWAAGALLGSAASTAILGTFTLGKLTELGIILAGTALINAVLPQPVGGGAGAAPSPTYSIGAQGNAPRIEQAIPVQYGRLLVYPDWAAQPYAEFAGNEQYLYQLFCLGCGEYDVEEVRIEDTPISAFAEVETQIVAPGADLTLFPANVITSVEVAGQELVGRESGTWSRTTTTVTVTETAHGRAVGQAVHLEFTTGTGPADDVYTIATVPTDNTFTVTTASGASSGNCYVRTVVGGIDGFVASNPDTTAAFLGIDLVLPVGLFDQNGDDIDGRSVTVTIQAREVDEDGLPVGSWLTLASETITDKTNTPLRKSFRYTLAAPGRYRVRAWRTDQRSASSTDGHDVSWAGLRAYLAETPDFGDVTLLAVRMRATNNLSAQASRKVAVLQTRKLPIWNGSTWSAPTASRSIAWALADMARDSAYGANLADARIDLEALLALDAIWAARGDYFDGRFDQSQSWWEAAQLVAQAGRAQAFLQGGVLRCVRDGADAPMVAMFTMRNIVRGSFGMDILTVTEDTADAVEVAYFDNTTWAPRRVKVALPGSSSGKPQKVDRFGVTDRGQIHRDAWYLAASNKYRRRVVRHETEMEGFIPSLGDVVGVQHVTPNWGQHGEAVAWDDATLTLTVTEALTWGGGMNYVSLRRADGSQSGPWAVTQGASPDQLVFSEDPTGDLGAWRLDQGERTHIAFAATSATTLMRCKVSAVRPVDMLRVSIEAVPDDARVHTAEVDQKTPIIVPRALPRVPVKPVVTGLRAALMTGAGKKVMISWNAAPGAESYHVELGEGDNPDDPDVSYTRVADTSATHHTIDLLRPNKTVISVYGMGLAKGDPVRATLGELLGLMWNTNKSLMWTGDSNLMWNT